MSDTIFEQTEEFYELDDGIVLRLALFPDIENGLHLLLFLGH